MSEWREEDIVLIERYLNGELSNEELLAFEQQLKVDKTLQQHLKILTDLKEGIVQAGRNDLASEIRQWEKNETPITRTIPIWKQSWTISIAAILLIGVTAILLWPQSENTSNLFDQYFEPYPNVVMPTVRGVEINDTTTIQKAYRAYDQEDYAGAVQFFETLETKDEGTLLYLGNSYLMLNETKKAISVLEKLVNKQSQFEEEAKWYLGLSYLKNGDNAMVKNTFDGIKSEHYQIKIKEILKQADH